MKRLFLSCFALAAALVLSGCTKTLLTSGKYSAGMPREDYAVVYNDLIFLHVKAPSTSSTPSGYWNWAGKYKLESNGVLLLDMDRDAAREWNFAYQFFRQSGGIVCNDWEKNSSFVLRYEAPSYRGSTQQPGSNGGSNPVYTDMSGN